MPVNKHVLIFLTELELQKISKKLKFLTEENYFIDFCFDKSLDRIISGNQFSYLLCTESAVPTEKNAASSLTEELKLLGFPIIVLSESKPSLKTKIPALYWSFNDSPMALKSLLECQEALFSLWFEIREQRGRESLKDWLVASLAHNMNGPITPLMGLTENHVGIGEWSEKVQHLLQAAVKRLADQIAHLNLFATLNDGEVKLKQTSVCMHDFLFSLDALRLPVVQEKKIRFVLEGAALQQRVRIDKPYFQRVLNACLSVIVEMLLPETDVRLECHLLSLSRLQKRREFAYAEHQLFVDFFVEQTLQEPLLDCLISVSIPAQNGLTESFKTFFQKGLHPEADTLQGLLFLALDALIQCLKRQCFCFYMETQSNGGFSFGFVLPSDKLSS